VFIIIKKFWLGLAFVNSLSLTPRQAALMVYTKKAGYKILFKLMSALEPLTTIIPMQITYDNSSVL